MVKNKVRIAQLILILIVLFSLTSVLGIIVYSLNLKKTPPPIVQPIPQPNPVTPIPTPNPTPTPAVPVQPVMPTDENEASKSPEALVKDFYEWYIGSTDYRTYQAFQLNIEPINLNELLQKSPFVSSKYMQNMEKRKGMYESVLCTNDTEFNVVKEYGKAQISGDSAEMEIKRGYTKTTDITEITVKLKKENYKWKIDDIICNFPK